MSDPVTPTVKNADIVINKGGVLYRTYSFKPSKQTELATATSDIAALKTAVGDNATNLGSRVDTLETAINGNGSDVAGIEARLTAQENAWSTFFTGETDNSKVDTLKEVLAEINTNTSSIADILTNKVNKSDVVDTTTVEQGGSLTGKVASASLVKSVEDDVAQNATDIAANTSAIATNTAAIATNASAIQTNAADIDALETRVDNLIQVVNAIPSTTTAGTTYIVVDEDTPASGSGE